VHQGPVCQPLARAASPAQTPCVRPGSQVDPSLLRRPSRRVAHHEEGVAGLVSGRFAERDAPVIIPSVIPGSSVVRRWRLSRMHHPRCGKVGRAAGYRPQCGYNVGRYRTLNAVELSTAEHIDWFNQRRP